MKKRILLFFLSKVLLVFCTYSYQSNEEAYLLLDHSLCMGNCYHHDGALKCVYDWKASEAECKATDIKTKNYTTLEGHACLSNCGQFGETYNWCAAYIAGKLSWDRCTRLEDLRGKPTYQTANQYLTCLDACSKRSDAYPWCNTVLGWQHCDPNNKVILFHRHTQDHVMCASPCALFESQPFCYDHDGEWKRCFLNQNKNNEVSKISKHLESNWNYGEYSENGYKPCRRLKRREFLDSVDVEFLAKQYESEFSTVVVRSEDDNNVVTNNRDPTVQYTVFDQYNKFGEDQFVVPLVYKGIVTNYTLRNDAYWTENIESNYNRMNPILTGAKQDSKGYLLASRLGGPAERFNIFPQSSSYNGNYFPISYYLDTDIFNFIDRHYESYAKYTAVLSYDLSASTPYRPTAIGLSVSLYNKNGVLCDTN